MSEKTFAVPNISCHHCVASIKDELTEIPGVQAVSGDPGKKQIQVTWDSPATEDAIRKAMAKINYPASD
ncbi:MAG: heavy-metal-associated domain-containing protein [Pseudomonadota bacterium]